MHAVAIDGTFDDCQALVKAMFNDLAFRDRVRLAGVNSINWARVVAQIVYYFAAAAALGAPAPAGLLRGADRQLRRHLRRLRGRRMGLPIERLVIATNDNDILARTHATGVYEVRGVTATTSPSMDIQVSSNFERYLFEACGPRRRLGARAAWARSAQSGRFELRPGALEPMQQRFRGRQRQRGRGRRLHPPRAGSAAAICSIRTPPAASSPPSKAGAGRQRRMSCSPPPIRPSFPMPCEAITGERPALPPRLASLMTRPGAHHRAAQRSRRPSQRFVDRACRASQGAAA